MNKAVTALYAPALVDRWVYVGAISAENWTRHVSADGARTEEIQMSYSTALDNGIVCDITAEYLDGEIGLYIKNYRGGTGAASVTVNAKIGVPDAQGDILNPSYTDEATISFEIKPELDANLPTEITISQNRYTVQTGETLELQFADIQFADGQIPDGAQVNRDYFAAAENVVRDADDESARFTFDEAGRHILYAYASVNGIDYIKEIAVTVGSTDAAITAEQYESLLYIRDGEYTEANVATLYFEETGYGGEDMARWEASVRYDGENATTVPEGSFEYSLDVDENGRWADFHIANPTCAGRIVFAISVNLNDGEYTASREFSVDIEQLTDADMAKQLADMQTVYEVASGDSITFAYAGIQPDVPQDQLAQYAGWRRVYDVLCDGVEYVDEDENGITFRFDHSGRYALRARMYRYGISLYRDIYVYVDAVDRTVSISPDAYVVNRDGYADDLVRYKLAEYSIENSHILDSDQIAWSIDNEDSFVLIRHEDNPRFVKLGITDQSRLATGENHVTVSLAIEDENGYTQVWQEAFTYTLHAEMPDNLPSGIVVNDPDILWNEEAGRYEHRHIDPGARCRFVYDSIDFAENADTELAAYVERSFNISSVERDGENYIEWRDGEIYCEFNVDATYDIYANISYSSRSWTVPIRIVVGEGVNPDWNVGLNQKVWRMYKSASDQTWIGSAGVWNANIYSDERIAWTAECTNAGDARTAPGLRFETHDGGYNADIFVENLESATCTEDEPYYYTITVTDPLSGSVRSWDTELWISEAPDQSPLPEDITVQETWNIYAGDMIDFRWDAMQSTGEGVLDSYDEQWFAYHFYDDVRTESYHGGAIAWFMEPGDYSVRAVMGIGNMIYSKIIAVHVDALPENKLNLELRRSEGALYLDCIGDGYDIGYAYAAADDSFEIVEWTAMPVGDNGNAELRMEDGWDDGRGQHLRLYNIDQSLFADGEEERTLTFDITATAMQGDAEYTAEGTISIKLLRDLPENMPDTLDIESDYYELTLDENGRAQLELSHDQIYWFGSGYVPANAQVNRGYHFDYDYLVNERGVNIEDIENGIRLTFTRDGEYCIRAAMGFGGWWCTREIVIRVGSGVIDAFELNVEQPDERVYTGSRFNWWMGNAAFDSRLVNGYNRVEWSIEPLQNDTGAELYIDNYVTDSDDEHAWLANIHLRNVEAPLTGTLIYRVTATVYGRDDLAIANGSRDFTVRLMDTAAPDTWPTAITAAQDQYAVNAGDGIDLYFRDIAPANGEVPEDKHVYYDYHMHTPEGVDWWDIWEDDRHVGYHIQINGEVGRFEINAAMYIGAYELTAPICIQVGDGTNPDWGFSLDQKVWRMYKSASDQTWIGSAGVWNANIYSDERIAWTAECTNAGDARTAPGLRFETHDGGYNADIFVENLESATCTEDEPYYYTITVTDPLSGSVRSWDTELWISEAPDQSPLPEDITVQETWNIYAGDMIDFRWDAMQSTGEGVLDSYDEQWFAYHFYDDVRTESYQGGTMAWFMSPGEYTVGAMMGVGNIIYTKLITVHVDSLPENRLNLELRKNVGALYLDCAEDGFEIASAYVAGDAAVEIAEWTAMPVGDNGNAELRMEEGWDDGRGQHLRLYNIDQSLFADGEEERTLTFDITATAMQGDAECSAEGTISIRLLRNLPDDLPDDLDIESEGYELTLDENGQARLELDYGLIYWFCNGNVPANVQVQYDYWADWDNMTGVAVEHLDYGKTLTFTQAGSYRIQAAAGFNGYWCTHDINITVSAA